MEVNHSGTGSSATHPSREQLVGFVLGSLMDGSADSVADHVEQCPECERTVRDIEASSDTLIQSLRQPAQEDDLAEEAHCRQMVSAIEQIGREPSFTNGRAERVSSDEPAELGHLGHYELLDRIGRGGMGTVYKALHTKLNKVVALKVLPAERLKKPAAVERFEREMQAVGGLDHPNIVRATDAGEIDGKHYLVMELVDGVDLSALVRRMGPLGIADACELVRQAARGLEEAHEHGMVHRDIKPSNLMLAKVRRGEKPPVVKILDMGLALLDDRKGDGHDLTASGQLMGTVDYMAPEQGMDTHGVDIRADLYSLGASLYRLLTGVAPFPNERYETLMKKMLALSKEPPRPIGELRPNVPRELTDLIDRMLAKEPQQRPATPSDLVDAIVPFCEGHDLAALLVGYESAVGGEKNDTASVGEAQTEGDFAAASAAERKDGGNRKRVAIAGGILSVVVLLGLILTIVFKNGTIVVEGPDGGALPNDVSVRLRADGDHVEITSEKNWTVRANPGRYQVELRGGDDRFQFEGNTLTVSRFGRTSLRITRRDRQEQLTTAKPSGGKQTTEREVAEWVLDGGGTITVGPVSFRSKADLPANEFAIDSLILKGESLDTSDDLQRLTGLGSLTALHIQPPVPEGIDWQPLSELQTLRTLWVHDIRDFGDKAIKALGGLSKLSALYAYSTGVTDTGLADLPTSLTYLVLANTWITNQGMKNLPTLPMLRVLDLTGTHVRDEGMAHVVRACPNLFFLRSTNTRISDLGLQHVANLRKLGRVRLDHTEVSVRGIAVLKQSLPPPCIVIWDGDLEGSSAGSPSIAVSVKLRETIELGTQAKSVSFSNDDPIVAVGGPQGLLRVFDTDDLQAAETVDIPGEREDINFLQFSPDGKYLAAAGSDLHVLGVSDWTTQARLPTIAPRSVAWSPDGSMLANKGPDAFAVFETQTWKPRFSLPDQKVVLSVFSSDGNVLISGNSDGDAQWWSMLDGRALPITKRACELAMSSRNLLAARRDEPSVAYTAGYVGQAITYVDPASGRESGFALAGDGGARFGFSPDGNLLAIRYHRDADVVDLNEVRTGIRITRLPHPSLVRDIAFSPDGGSLATACDDGKVRLWDIKVTEPPPATIKPDSEPKPPDGKQLTEREVAEWVLDGGGMIDVGREFLKSKAELPAEDFRIRKVSLRGSALQHPDDLWHLAGLRDLQLLGISSPVPEGINWQPLSELRALRSLSVPAVRNFDDKGIRALAALPNLDRLVADSTGVTDTGLADLPASLRSLNLPHTRITNQGMKNLPALPMLRRLNLIATQIADEGLADVVRACPDLFHLRLDECTRIGDPGLLHVANLRHLGRVRLDGTKVSARGVAVLKQSLPPACVVIWDGDPEGSSAGSPSIGVSVKLRETIEFGAQPRSVSFSADAPIMAVGGPEGLLRVFDTNDLQAAETVDIPGEREDIQSLQFSPDGKYLAAVGSILHVLDVSEWTTQARLPRWAPKSVAWSPDGRLLANKGADALTVFDTQTWKPRFSLPDQKAGLSVFSSDGNVLITANSDGDVQWWSMQDGTALPITHRACALAMSSRNLLAARRAHQWNREQQEIRYIDPESGRASGFALAGEGGARFEFSPDGNLLAIRYEMWDLELVDLNEVKTGLRIARLPHPSPVRDIAFTPDGGSLATACDDGKVRLWEIKVTEPPPATVKPDSEPKPPGGKQPTKREVSE